MWCCLHPSTAEPFIAEQCCNGLQSACHEGLMNSQFTSELWHYCGYTNGMMFSCTLIVTKLANHTDLFLVRGINLLIINLSCFFLYQITVSCCRDKQFPALGFGAKLPDQAEASTMHTSHIYHGHTFVLAILMRLRDCVKPCSIEGCGNFLLWFELFHLGYPA